jgi:hypothetical protein
MKKEEIKRSEAEEREVREGLSNVQLEREGNFFEPKPGCEYFIKSVKKGIIIEANEDGNIKERKFDPKFLIQSYFMTEQPEDWMDSRSTPKHNDLTDPIFMGWIKAEPLSGDYYRSKKLNADKDVYTLTSKAGDRFEIVKVRNPYQWIKA